MGNKERPSCADGYLAGEGGTMPVFLWTSTGIAGAYAPPPAQSLTTGIILASVFLVAVLSMIVLGRRRRNRRLHGQLKARRRRKSLEDRLRQLERQSEEKFRAIADYTYDWENWVGPDGKLLWVNPAVERLTGYSRQEVMAMRDFPRPLIVEEDWPKMQAAFRNSLQGKTVESPLEFRIRRKDGRIAWGAVVAQSIYDDQGRHIGHRSSIRDITDRKRTEAELRHSEERFRALFEGAGDGIFIADQTGRYLDVNARGAEMLGYSRQEILDRKIVDIVVEEERSRVPSEVALTLGGHPHVAEWQFLRKDGSTFFGEVNSQVLPDGRAMGILRDITDRKLAIQTIENEKQYSDSIIESLPGVFYLFDQSGRYLRWNRNFETITGYSSEELAKLHPLDFFRGQDKEYIASRIQKVFAEGAAHAEAVMVSRTGRRTPFYFTGRRIAFKGRPCLVGLGIDITKRKQAEESLQALNLTLEQRVAERTRLAEHRADQLRQLAAMLTESEQKERRRIAHILHEHFQQLLFAAKLRLDRLKTQLSAPLADSAQEIDRILTEGIHVSKSLAVELCPPILYELGLVPALEWLATSMRDKYGLTVEMTAEPEAEPASDPLRILLFNSISELLFNVVKHAKVSTARLDISRSPSGQIEIIVSDDGPGFDPSARQDYHSTTGMGLFGIRERMNFVGGGMEIDSAPGRGSRFKIWVPAGETPPVQAQTPIAAAVAGPSKMTAVSPSDQGAARKIRVLLVDDHAVVRQGIALLLKEAPDVEIAGEAPDGQTAVDMARRLLPDVVLMDISMPGMDGIEATRIIHGELPDVRVIALSMFDQSAQSAAIEKAGASDYLNKSGDMEALIVTVRKWGSSPALAAAMP